MQFSIIPVQPKNKKPFIKWEPYQKEAPSEDQIKVWWDKWPQANIGIVTGALSGLTVIDVDSAAGDEAIEEHLPDSLVTPVARSPKGRHLYFKYQEGITNNVRFLTDCDIRSEGGYIIAPPSRNGTGKAYQWAITPKKDSIAVFPTALLSILSTPIARYSSSLLDTRGGVGGGIQAPSLQLSAKSTTVHKLFELHARNQDLFHVALQLFKGRTSESVIMQVLDNLGKSCNPPWGSQPEDGPVEIIIESAYKHFRKKERNIAEEVREELLSTNGDFLSTELERCLQLTTREEKKNLSIILKRLSEGENPIIKKNGTRRGAWTTIDNTIKFMDFVNVDLSNTVNLRLPLDIQDKTVFFPKSVIVLAGVTGYGKTSFALNFIKDNMEKHQIFYFNAEMSPEALNKKLSYFDIPIIAWNMQVVEGWDYRDIAAKVFPDAINVIDYLEPEGEKAYGIHGIISNIINRLNKGMAFITVQKKKGVELGAGGVYSAKAASLYLSLEWGNIMIYKNRFREEDPHPLLDTIDFEIVNGCNIRKTGMWYNSRESKTRRF